MIELRDEADELLDQFPAGTTFEEAFLLLTGLDASIFDQSSPDSWLIESTPLPPNPLMEAWKRSWPDDVLDKDDGHESETDPSTAGPV